MTDITANKVNAATGANIFVTDSNGYAAISLSTLTGDTVTMDTGLNESMLKLLEACSTTAQAEFDADNANDARSSYPASTKTPTTANGEPILRVSASTVGKVVISSSLDAAVVL
ncbi:MAG: hypothetical protein AAF572_11665 [Cyanobacteria bacterium P01_B01_bin.77]